eukprot:gnl/TRDRNA2_/TRDRNA2_165059_c0_seq1.p1 gnl/TRDRNA2_/TRDRNA2_165059_c0~~gnl/TRDRNA2_/TRDRNA2_165059_c0_seq1.p1  ORF type:complete len:388 (-),score=75.78 gnl/TRDRNA2_/TRDRNA2_165059_c0_seq1:241-1263(-)
MYSERGCYEQALLLNPADAESWLNLGAEGGGDVDGDAYAAKECYAKALTLDPEDALAWLSLGSLAGGVVSGQGYSEKVCYEMALSLNPLDAVAWSDLAAVGGGHVDGQLFSVPECYEKAKQISNEAGDDELILQQRISEMTPVPAPEPFVLYKGEEKRWSFVHVKGLLDEEMIETVHDCFGRSGAKPLGDRKYTLDYNHDAFPIGLALRSHAPSLYERICGVMKWVDAEVWNTLDEFRKEVVCLAFEYIMYDARKGAPGTIGPHVDNNSLVTMIILLADTKDFHGGMNCFGSSGSSSDDCRPLQLQRGDAVLFRGEELMHWITPVTDGLRIILQVELSNF